MKTKKLFIQLSSSVVILLLLLTSAFAASWPADSTATNVGSGLGAYYEPSGVVYHTGLNKLFVVSDEGILSMMNSDGTSVSSWTFRDAFNYNDFEGVTVADPTTNYVYVLTEYPFAITQFDISTGTVVQSWSLTSIIPAPTNTRYGLEGMTYVSTEGLFAVGSQESGTIYFISVPITTMGFQVSLVRSIQPTSSVSDLYFNAETEILYILAGSSLTESNLQGTVIAQYTVPGSGQEGVTLAPACSGTTTSIFIAEDHGNTDLVPDVSKYNNYPITCVSSGTGSSEGTTTSTVWPASSSGTNVGSGLSSTFEPSGVVWNSASSKLIVVNDNGGVSTMNSDGSSVTSWTLSGDLEGVSTSGASTAYVLNEYPFEIYEFDTTTGTKTKTWDLSSIGLTTPSTTSNGLEGMAYIPDGDHSYGTTSFDGIFAVGSSDDGRIYFVSVPTSSGSATLLGSMQPAGEAITDMYYSADTELLYVLYGTTLREMKLDGTVVATYTSVPGTDPEGITFVSDCTAGTAVVYIANDVGNTVMKYTGYPITCISGTSSTPTNPDTDGDGLLDTEEATYGTNPLLVDTDSDGLTDYQEVITYGTNALVADTDGDALSDGAEVLTYLTNPLVADTDSGSVNDGQEVTNGTNPLDGSDDVPIVIDPNLISSYTIDSVNALVTVYYADGHSKTINPFTGTDPILVGLSYDNTVLVVTNGKRMKTYQNSVAKDNEYISKYTPSSMTLTITYGTSSDDVVLTYVVSGKTRTARFTLTGTNLVKY